MNVHPEMTMELARQRQAQYVLEATKGSSRLAKLLRRSERRRPAG
jgi:hypothetical protein